MSLITWIAPKSSSMRQKKENTDTEKKAEVKTKTEIGEIQPQVKDCEGLPSFSRSQQTPPCRFYLRAPRVSVTLPTPSFWTLASKTVRECISVVLSHPGCGTILQTPLSMGFPRQEYWSGLPFPSPRLKP